MLVLSRKVGERILIGDDVVVTVVEVLGNRVRLGIEAPRSKKVMRSEIADVPLLTPPNAPFRSNHRLCGAVAALHN
ncbi:MAG: carbon storage regulator [Gemmataceae bacterium]